MSKRHWIISAGAGIALLLTSCTTNRTKTQAAPSAPQAFTQPIIPAKSLPPVKITGMIQTTDSNTALMPVAVASDRDPFAATAMPTNLRATIQPAKTIAAQSSSIGTQPIALPQPTLNLNPTPMPPVTVSTLPPLQAQPLMPLPTPPTSQTNLADAIALTGVMQTGTKLSAIVQDSDGTSRYVQAGESLAGGQVTVKRINLNPAGLPSIVLQHNGVEFTKTVGSSDSVAQAL